MKRGQTLDYRAKDIEGDLDWIRNKGDAPDSFGEISNTFRATIDLGTRIQQ